MAARRGIVVALCAAALLVAGFVSSSSLVNEGEAATAPVTPAADAYVGSDAPSANYGLSAKIRVDGSPLVRSYLMFDLTAVPAVARAELELTATSTHSRGFAVRTSAPAWQEGTITWANAPPPSATTHATVGPFTAGQTIRVDVTSAVSAGTIASLVLVDRSSTTAMAFGSRQSATPPRLVITYDAGTTGGSTTAATTTEPPTTTTTTPPTTTTTTTTPPTTTTTTTTATTTTPPTGDPRIAAAGDIACEPGQSPSSGGCQQLATSNLIHGQGYAAVLALGDLQYEDGTLAKFQGSYHLSWGRFKATTRPAVGNHEYLTPGAAGYFDYWNTQAGARGQGYYSYDVGPWHLIALNTNCSQSGGCGTSSPQYQWLQADLAATSARCVLVYHHHPRYASGTGDRRDNTALKPIHDLLYDRGADVVLVAHNHWYERLGHMGKSAAPDPAGPRYFVVGTGGKNRTSPSTPLAGSEVRDTTSFGVLELTLHPEGYDWRFRPAAGYTFTDSGSDTCSTGTPPTTSGAAKTTAAGTISSLTLQQESPEPLA